MLYGPWHISLLGALTARNESLSITRFRTRQTAMLLACLAYSPKRPQSREELADRLWPEVPPEASRTRLRVALSSLRRQMEPPGVPTGSVLVADRNSIYLRSESFTTDVAVFQSALHSPTDEELPPMQAERLSRAVAAYSGELLPGVYDDWVLGEREGLATQYRRTLEQLLEIWEILGNRQGAQECAERLITADPHEEKGYLALMRLAVQAGEPALAVREFDRMERLLERELGLMPSKEAREAVAVARAARPVPFTPSVPSILSGQALVSRLPSSLPPEVPPPLRVLPPSWTRFFGREAEQETLLGLLAEGGTRLVTLTGPGGAGKTRLATEVARRLAETFPGPVCFVPLADILSAPLLPETISVGLRLTYIGSNPPLDQITEALIGKPALLILDNLEQIADGAAPIIQSLLIRLPDLRCLITSRRPLHLPGERVLPLPPLPTPLQVETPEGLLAYAGVQLFVDRAQAVRPDFQVTPRNADAVSALCDRLEGLPLALELAAAWTGVLTPAQALARLDERSSLLVSRRSDQVKRHRTMHAAIAWSFDLLPADLRGFWTRLSVFRGGWTAEAAEAVCAQPGTLEALQRLRERSLILAEEVNGGASMRFRMLESLREFACEQPNEQEAAETRRCHAAFFLDLVEAKYPQTQGAEAKTGLDAVEAERANILTALEWYDRPDQDPELGLRVAGALWRFWSIRGPLAEGQWWLNRTLARTPDAETETVARAWNGLAVLFRVQGDTTQAKETNQRVLDLWRRIGDARGIAASLNNLGGTLMVMGDFQAAQPLLEESLSLWRTLDRPLAVAQLLQNLGFLACECGDPVAATALCRESLALFQSQGDQLGISQVHSILASAAIRQKEFCQANCLAAKSMRLSVELGHAQGIINSFEVLAEAACGSGEAWRPAVLLGAAETLAVSLGMQIERTGEDCFERVFANLRGRETEAAIQAAFEHGRTLTQEAAIALALEEPENPQSAQ